MKRKGFTLLEVLAAMAIFSMIMVMMANVFHQSTIAWDSGTRKAQGAIEARVILANIARELQHAVAVRGRSSGDPLRSGEIPDDYAMTSITFISMGDREMINASGASGFRDAYKISYELSGNTLLRQEQLIDEEYTYDTSITFGGAIPYAVATNVLSILFTTPRTALDSSMNPPRIDEALPRWVTVTLEMGRMDDVSGVAAVSRGEDGMLDPVSATKTDDIKSY